MTESSDPLRAATPASDSPAPLAGATDASGQESVLDAVTVLAVTPPSKWWPKTLGEIRKFITAVAGLVVIAVTQGLVSGTAAKWVAVGVGLATALGVYVVPNNQAASSGG